MTSVCINLPDKPERKTQLGRLRCGWEDNIKMDVKGDILVWTAFMWYRTEIISGVFGTR
jgi:hypothetical protein